MSEHKTNRNIIKQQINYDKSENKQTWGELILTRESVGATAGTDVSYNQTQFMTYTYTDGSFGLEAVANEA